MAATLQIRRPPPTVDPHARSGYRNAGALIGLVGVALAMVALVANVVAADRITDSPVDAGEILAWSFGLATTAFGVLKFGIAVVLIGIVLRLWVRVDTVKAALARLKPEPAKAVAPEVGDIDTDFGPATASTVAAEPLFIHRVAKVAWAPMLAMGTMAVVAGLVLSIAWSGNVADDASTARDLQAWTEGLQFLGEAFLLGGISFLLGTILAGLREGGGEVQESLGVTVKTLKMPLTAKLFVGLMAAGMMVSMAQFVLYLVAASSSQTATSFAAWTAWLGPVRGFGLGLLLSGIVLALVTIGTVLRFQFDRIATILRTGL
ncbi:MAG: hypothetical protein HYU28_03500 [Actinobacteria bacterium]|nr:hypothetical protein [Actinomycetota bacterium]